MDAGVAIEAEDRAGLKRLLRYYPRASLALERLRELDPAHLIYDHPKSGPGARVPLILTSLGLIDRIAAIVPPRAGNFEIASARPDGKRAMRARDRND